LSATSFIGSSKELEILKEFGFLKVQIRAFVLHLLVTLVDFKILYFKIKKAYGV
jgi:hypothetical protein